MSCERIIRELWPYFRTLDDLNGVLNWESLFGNENRIEIDVGCGRGLFLANAGSQQPDRNFLGIEADFHEGRRAARRVMKREMPNVRVLGGDAQQALRLLIPPASVSAVHVYFPDPWWKKRHQIRRLFTDTFVDQVATVLQPAGLLHVWTDVTDYFQVMSALVDHHDQFERLAQPSEREAAHDMDYHTSFERKKRKAGLTIHRGLWKRHSTPSLLQSVPADLQH